MLVLHGAMLCLDPYRALHYLNSLAMCDTYQSADMSCRLCRTVSDVSASLGGVVVAGVAVASSAMQQVRRAALRAQCHEAGWLAGHLRGAFVWPQHVCSSDCDPDCFAQRQYAL